MLLALMLSVFLIYMSRCQNIYFYIDSRHPASAAATASSASDTIRLVKGEMMEELRSDRPPSQHPLFAWCKKKLYLFSENPCIFFDVTAYCLTWCVLRFICAIIYLMRSHCCAMFLSASCWAIGNEFDGSIIVNRHSLFSLNPHDKWWMQKPILILLHSRCTIHDTSGTVAKEKLNLSIHLCK